MNEHERRRMMREALTMGADETMHYSADRTRQHVHKIRSDGSLGPPSPTTDFEFAKRCYERSQGQESDALR